MTYKNLLPLTFLQQKSCVLSHKYKDLLSNKMNQLQHSIEHSETDNLLGTLTPLQTVVSRTLHHLKRWPIQIINRNRFTAFTVILPPTIYNEVSVN